MKEKKQAGKDRELPQATTNKQERLKLDDHRPWNILPAYAYASLVSMATDLHAGAYRCSPTKYPKEITGSYRTKEGRKGSMSNVLNGSYPSIYAPLFRTVFVFVSLVDLLLSRFPVFQGVILVFSNRDRRFELTIDR